MQKEGCSIEELLTWYRSALAAASCLERQYWEQRDEAEELHCELMRRQEELPEHLRILWRVLPQVEPKGQVVMRALRADLEACGGE